MCMFMVVVVCVSIIWKTTNKQRKKKNLTKQILCRLACVPRSSPGFKSSSLVNTAPRATRGAPKPD